MKSLPISLNKCDRRYPVWVRVEYGHAIAPSMRLIEYVSTPNLVKPADENTCTCNKPDSNAKRLSLLTPVTKLIQ